LTAKGSINLARHSRQRAYRRMGRPADSARCEPIPSPCAAIHRSALRARAHHCRWASARTNLATTSTWEVIGKRPRWRWGGSGGGDVEPVHGGAWWRRRDCSCDSGQLPAMRRKPAHRSWDGRHVCRRSAI